jgi:hypothetical protein
MESIKFWSGAQGLSVLSKQYLGGSSRIDNDHWNVSQLDLIDTAICFRPLAILLSSILSNLPQVTDQKETAWATKTRDSSRFPNKLVHDDIQDTRQSDRDGDVLAEVFLGAVQEVLK